jgi:hypothetical protein
MTSSSTKDYDEPPSRGSRGWEGVVTVGNRRWTYLLYIKSEEVNIRKVRYDVASNLYIN